MENVDFKVLKEELTAQLHSYRIDKFTEDVSNHLKTNNVNSKFQNIILAKNEWETCVDLLKHQALIVLDNSFNVIRANRTIELWGWGEVDKVVGTHLLNLIKPAFGNDEANDWIEEWSQLNVQEISEWESSNYVTGKRYRFSFYPNNEIDSLYHEDDCYAVMLITDISNQKILVSQNNCMNQNNISLDENDSTDIIRLSAYRLHQLANRLVNSQDEVRKGISSDLHDGLGQILSALKYQIESIVYDSDKSNKLRKSDIAIIDVLKKANFALTELRRVSSNLRPSVLDERGGLLMSLKWFFDEYNKIYTDLNVEMYIDILEEDIPEKNRCVIYRIVQESVNNIAKHAYAKNVFLLLTKSEAGILLRISDDGRGFDLNKVKQNKKSGLGLNSMEERAIDSGGKYSISSNHFSGTVVQVFWPID